MNPVGLVGEIIFIEFGLNFSRRIYYALLMHLKKSITLIYLKKALTPSWF